MGSCRCASIQYSSRCVGCFHANLAVYCDFGCAMPCRTLCVMARAGLYMSNSTTFMQDFLLNLRLKYIVCLLFYAGVLFWNQFKKAI